MIIGIGMDMLEIERVRKACEKQAFVERVYTEEERRQAGEKISRLAGDFAVKEAVAKGLKAGDIIKAIAPICGGKGGGKPDSAMGGGNDPMKLDDALAALDDFVASKVGA